VLASRFIGGLTPGFLPDHVLLRDRLVRRFMRRSLDEGGKAKQSHYFCLLPFYF